MAGENSEEAGGFPWDCLVPKVVHPVQVEIIEALRQTGEPLCVADFKRVSGRSRLEHHVDRLVHLGVLRTWRGNRLGDEIPRRWFDLLQEPGTVRR